MLLPSSSLIGFHDSMSMYLQSASKQSASMINYQQWRMSWYAFVELLDINYEEGFSCQQCGQYPKVVCCDATTLSFRREYAQELDVSRDTLENESKLEGR